MSDDEIQAAIEAGFRAFHEHRRKPRGTMMQPGDHEPTYWIARAVERAARAAAFREAADYCDSLVADEIATGKVDHNEMAWTQHCAMALRARAEGQSNG